MVDQLPGHVLAADPHRRRDREAASLPYRANMTLLDAMIEVGGLSEFAAGDRARLVRQDKATGKQKEYDLKISRLIKRGDTQANVRLEPGDVIIIPESMF
jgi:polysaccharide export outer membrane protein